MAITQAVTPTCLPICRPAAPKDPVQDFAIFNGLRTLSDHNTRLLPCLIKYDMKVYSVM